LRLEPSLDGAVLGASDLTAQNKHPTNWDKKPKHSVRKTKLMGNEMNSTMKL